MADTKRTEIDAAMEAARSLHGIQLLPLADAPSTLFAPSGMKRHDVRDLLRPWLQTPERKTGTATLSQLASFVSFANRHKNVSSALFADDDIGHPSILAIFDYHHKDDQGESDSGARFCEHRAAYDFPLSEEWQFWANRTHSGLSQEAFAQLLENRVLDVADPTQAGDATKAFAADVIKNFATPARLLEISRDLTVHVASKVVERRDRASGAGVVFVSEEHSDDQGQPLSLPDGFILSIPVFRNGERFQVPVRLRYRVSGKVTFTLEPHRTDLIFRAAYTEACDAIAKATDMPVYYGKPETRR